MVVINQLYNHTSLKRQLTTPITDLNCVQICAKCWEVAGWGWWEKRVGVVGLGGYV